MRGQGEGFRGLEFSFKLKGTLGGALSVFNGFHRVVLGFGVLPRATVIFNSTRYG